MKPLIYNSPIINQWHPTKNSALDPRKLTTGCGKRAWWLCEKGHEWEALISSRTKRGCPFCNGKKASRTNNVTLMPFYKDWHPTKNSHLNPIEVTSGSDKKVWWLCEKGHEWQTNVYHRKKTGCPYCSHNLTSSENSAKLTPFFYEWHPLKNIDLDPTTISKKSTKRVWWLCKDGHEWQASLDNRSAGTGCPYCCNKYSKLEQLTEKLLNLKKYNKKILKDFGYLPDFKITENLYLNADGLYWHCELNKEKYYHYSLREAFEAENKRILQFYEDEIYNKPEIVKSIVDNLLGKNKKIFARKCELNIVKNLEANEFLEKNHLIGRLLTSRHIGLYYENELVMLMSYQTKEKEIDITRVCTKIGHVVVGGLSRLIKQLPKTKAISTIIDLRYATGKSFMDLGFKPTGKAKINYQYANHPERKDKRLFRVKAGTNEREEAAKKHWYRIWDAGKLKLVLAP